jgi:hypothetical protein
MEKNPSSVTEDIWDPRKETFPQVAALVDVAHALGPGMHLSSDA